MLDAAFRRCGVLRVDRIAELFYMAEVLAKQPRPRGPRLTIVTNAGGPGVLATDALIGGGGELAALAAETMAALDAVLPPHWSHGNPIDVLGDAGPERYAKALEVAAADPNSDGLLVILTPQAMTDPTQTAEALEALRPDRGQAGPGQLDGRRRRRGRRGDPAARPASRPSPTPTPPPAPSTHMWRYSRQPARPLRDARTGRAGPDAGRARPRPGRAASIQAVRGRGPDAADRGRVEAAARRLRHPDRRHARRRDDEARPSRPPTRSATRSSLKLHSETITHKTDVGGVRLNLARRRRGARAPSRDPRRRSRERPAPGTSWA